MLYPALNLNFYEYTPSSLISLNDIVLPHSSLRVCLDSYLGGIDITVFDPINDPLLSPTCAS